MSWRQGYWHGPEDGLEGWDRRRRRRKTNVLNRDAECGAAVEPCGAAAGPVVEGADGVSADEDADVAEPASWSSGKDGVGSEGR